MARNRLPGKKAEVSGAALKNPQRYRNRNTPGGNPLGGPYPTMTRAQCGVWRELAVAMPWLRAHHRIILRLACILAARMDEDPNMGLTAHRTLSGIMAKLGGSPVDDSRVAMGDDDAPDPTDRFFGGRPN